MDEIIGASGALSVNSVALIMRQAISGLKFLHSHGLVLGALGPANIILRLNSLRQHRAQLVDIGLRKFFFSALDSETRSYIAPEIERGDRVGPKADMWSVGAIVYRLLTPGSTFRDVKTKQSVLDLSKTQCSGEVRTTLKRLLSWNPSRRYSAADALEMNWLAKAHLVPFQLRLPRNSYISRLTMALHREKSANVSDQWSRTSPEVCLEENTFPVDSL